MKILCTFDLHKVNPFDKNENGVERKLVQVVADNKLHAFSKIRKHYERVNSENFTKQNMLRYTPMNIDELETID